MQGSIRPLDNTILELLKSEISPKASELLNLITNNHTVRFMDYRTNPNRAATAYTEKLGAIYYMWLDPDEDEIADTFVHEIGQIYTHTLGYRREAEGRSWRGRRGDAARELAGMIVNAFRGAITERNLQRYGIDRSHYRQRRHQAFEEYLNHLPNGGIIERDAISSLLGRTRLCYEYNYSRLILLEEFGNLEKLWTEKVSSEKVKKDAMKFLKWHRKWS
jgi:hypothetical protein